MVKIVYIMGLPGSGKSSAARAIQSIANQLGWNVRHFCDYYILYEMYQLDQKRGEGRFRPTDYDGFDVCDSGAFDEVLEKALKKVNSTALDWIEEKDNINKLCIIEFARDDYSEALKFFDKRLLPPYDTYFLFFDADIPACIKRIHDRVAKPDAERTLDDHFVSEDILDSYYQRDNRDYLHINRDNLHVIHNTGNTTMYAFHKSIEQIMLPILQPIPALPY